MRLECAAYCLLLLLIPHPAPAQTNGHESSKGSSIYDGNCAVCHGAKGEGGVGPSLQATHDPKQVIDVVRNGAGVMPAFASKLSSAEIKELSAYVTRHLAVVSLSGGDLAQGGALYRLNCGPCHRTAVRGGALAFSKTNAPALIGLSPATIAGAIRSGPGEMPSFPTSVLGEKDLASIVEYVRFMQEPPDLGGVPLSYYGPVAEGLVAMGVVVVLAVIAGWIEEKGRG